MKYLEFKEVVGDWLNKDNLSHIIPSLIRYGQEFLENDLRLEPMQTVQNIAIAQDTQSFLEPDRFIEMVSARLLSADDSHVKHPPLNKKEWQYFVDNGLPYTDARMPKTYARINIAETTDASLPDTGITALSGRSFLFDAPADAAYLLEYTFYRKELPFTTDISTNWWLTNAEEALLHATLIKASTYLANDDPRIKTWLAGYEIAKSSLEEADYRARRGGQAPQRNASH
ncbi:MAG: hypothetical protein KAV87_22465 [Desulfobacteraceae bacterium]|nr:hypothetical protein [Desulfobacteraceae bacterium]